MRAEAQTFLKIANATEQAGEKLSYVQFRAVYNALGLSEQDGNEIAKAMKQAENDEPVHKLVARRLNQQ